MMMMIHRIRITALMGMLVLALLAVPFAAAAENSYPVIDNTVDSQKAHLAWKAAVRETEMTASTAYIATLNGTSTATLDALLVQYKGQEAQIAVLSTHIGLNNLLRDMNQVNSRFRQELRSQMKNGRGKAADLKSAVDAAVQSDGNLAVLESAYWSARTTNELANFDTRVERATATLAVLKEKGYDTTAAQAKLEEITAQRPVLEAALNSHDATQIRSVQQQVLTLSQELARIVKDLQVQVPEEKKIRFHISEGNRAVVRAEMVNADLKTLGIDTAAAETYTAAAKAGLASAQSALDAKDPAGARALLDTVKEDFKSLAQAYRDIAKRYQDDAPTAATLNSTAQALDSMTASMESGA
jgi:hypothetical protein